MFPSPFVFLVCLETGNCAQKGSNSSTLKTKKDYSARRDASMIFPRPIKKSRIEAIFFWQHSRRKKPTNSHTQEGKELDLIDNFTTSGLYISSRKIIAAHFSFVSEIEELTEPIIKPLISMLESASFL